MTTICFLSLKGGTGKTTTVLNVGMNLMEQGFRVLLIDLDPAGYLGTATGLMVKGRRSVLALAEGVPLQELVQKTSIGIDIVPATSELNFLDPSVWMGEGEFRLAKHLEDLPYDFVLIDCNPSLNIVNLSGLAASDYLIIPTEPEFLALKGMRQMYLNLIDLTYSHKLSVEIKGIVVTKYDQRKKMHQQSVDQLKKMFGDTVFTTLIRSNVAVAKAMQKIQPLNEAYPDCNGSKDYKALTEEIIARFLKK
jgi:chromosome partitioning protein